MVTTAYGSSVGLLNFLWSIYPIILLKWKTPVLLWFPFPLNLWETLVPAYMFTVSSLYLEGMTQFLVDTLLLLCASNICSQLTDIKTSLQHLGEEQGVQLTNSQRIHILHESIAKHVVILKEIRILKNLVNLIFVAQIIQSTIMTCTVVFAVTKVDDVMDVLKFIPLAVATYIQLFIYCWFGERISYESALIKEALYDNGWENSSIDFRKSTLIGITCTTKSVVLSGGGVFTMSHKTFLAALRESFSYYTVLRTLTSKET